MYADRRGWISIAASFDARMRFGGSFVGSLNSGSKGRIGPAQSDAFIAT